MYYVIYKGMVTDDVLGNSVCGFGILLWPRTAISRQNCALDIQVWSTRRRQHTSTVCRYCVKCWAISSPPEVRCKVMDGVWGGRHVRCKCFHWTTVLQYYRGKLSRFGLQSAHGTRNGSPKRHGRAPSECKCWQIGRHAYGYANSGVIFDFDEFEQMR